jgi:hypothetical protein
MYFFNFKKLFYNLFSSYFYQKEDLANAVSAGASATQKMVLDEDD